MSTPEPPSLITLFCSTLHQVAASRKICSSILIGIVFCLSKWRVCSRRECYVPKAQIADAAPILSPAHKVLVDAFSIHSATYTACQRREDLILPWGLFPSRFSTTAARMAPQYIFHYGMALVLAEMLRGEMPGAAPARERFFPCPRSCSKEAARPLRGDITDMSSALHTYMLQRLDFS